MHEPDDETCIYSCFMQGRLTLRWRKISLPSTKSRGSCSHTKQGILFKICIVCHTYKSHVTPFAVAFAPLVNVLTPLEISNPDPLNGALLRTIQPPPPPPELHIANRMPSSQYKGYFQRSGRFLVKNTRFCTCVGFNISGGSFRKVFRGFI